MSFGASIPVRLRSMRGLWLRGGPDAGMLPHVGRGDFPWRAFSANFLPPGLDPLPLRLFYSVGFGHSLGFDRFPIDLRLKVATNIGVFSFSTMLRGFYARRFVGLPIHLRL